MARRDEARGVRHAAADAFALVGTTYLSQLVTLVLAFLLRRELGPEGMGYVAVTQIAMSYAPYAGLGSLQAAEREVAFERGRGDDRSSVELEIAATTTALLVAGIVSLGLLAAALLAWLNGRGLTAATISAIGVILVSQQLAVWGTLRLRTRFRFPALGWASASSAVIFSALTVAGAFVLGPGGALAGGAIGSVTQAVILIRTARVPRWRQPTWSAVATLARLSPGFLALGLSAVALGTVDQLAVGVLLGSSALGLYSAAYLGNGFVLRIPTLVNAVVYPRLQQELGSTLSPARVYALSRRTTALSVLVIPVVVASFVIALPVAVHHLLPAFAPAILAMRLLLIGVMGLAVGMPAMQYAITMNRQWLVITVSGAFLLLMGGAYAIAGVNGVMSIDVAASVDAIAYLAYGLCLQLLAAALEDAAAIPVVGRSLVPVVLGAVMIVMGAIADAIWYTHPNLTGSALGVAAQVGAFVIVWGLAGAVWLRFDSTTRRDVRALVDPLVVHLRRTA